MLWVLNLADGEHSLLDVAERAELPFATVAAAADALVEADLLEESAGEGAGHRPPRLHRLDRRPDARTRRATMSSGSTRSSTADCDFGEVEFPFEERQADIRDVTAAELEGFDAVVHLAALSNDPLGDLDEDLTYDINLRGTLHLAERAKEAGVERFVFASSCSMYGAASGDDLLDESAPLRPLTPYAESKVKAEAGLSGWPTTRSRRSRCGTRPPTACPRVSGWTSS